MKFRLISLITGLLFIFGLMGSISFVEAATRVKGYYKPSTGRYISPYYRTNSNSTRFDNWSTKGNYNPYTGKKGYANPIKSRTFFRY